MNTACVYKIYCKDAAVTEFYIGSTVDLRNRIWNHNSNYNNVNNSTSRQYHQKVYQFIRENGGISNWDFEVLEWCADGDEKKCEEKWLQQLNPTLNKRRAHKSTDEKAEYKHQHYTDNKDVYLERAKVWVNEHEEHVKERQKKWREDNAEILKEKKKKYYEENKEAIKAKVRERTTEKKDEINARRRELAKEKRDILAKVKI